MIIVALPGAKTGLPIWIRVRTWWLPAPWKTRPDGYRRLPGLYWCRWTSRGHLCLPTLRLGPGPSCGVAFPFRSPTAPCRRRRASHGLSCSDPYRRLTVTTSMSTHIALDSASSPGAGQAAGLQPATRRVNAMMPAANSASFPLGLRLLLLDFEPRLDRAKVNSESARRRATTAQAALRSAVHSTAPSLLWRKVRVEADTNDQPCTHAIWEYE